MNLELEAPVSRCVRCGKDRWIKISPRAVGFVNVNGNVIGIDTAIADPSAANNIGFAISIQGAPIASNDDVVRVVRQHRPGDSLRVVVARGHDQKKFEVTLGDLPSA